MGGRDHSCEGCGRGGFNDPDGVCECLDNIRPERVTVERCPECGAGPDDPPTECDYCERDGRQLEEREYIETASVIAWLDEQIEKRHQHEGYGLYIASCEAIALGSVRSYLTEGSRS